MDALFKVLFMKSETNLQNKNKSGRMGLTIERLTNQAKRTLSKQIFFFQNMQDELHLTTWKFLHFQVCILNQFMTFTNFQNFHYIFLFGKKAFHLFNHLSFGTILSRRGSYMFSFSDFAFIVFTTIVVIITRFVGLIFLTHRVTLLYTLDCL